MFERRDAGGDGCARVAQRVVHRAAPNQAARASANASTLTTPRARAATATAQSCLVQAAARRQRVRRRGGKFARLQPSRENVGGREDGTGNDGCGRERSTRQARRARRAWHKRAPSGPSSRREPGQEPWRKSRTAPRMRWSGEGACAATRTRVWRAPARRPQKLIATRARSSTCPSSRRMRLIAIVEGVEEKLFHLQRQQNGAP